MALQSPFVATFIPFQICGKWTKNLYVIIFVYFRANNQFLVFLLSCFDTKVHSSVRYHSTLEAQVSILYTLGFDYLCCDCKSGSQLSWQKYNIYVFSFHWNKQ